MAEKIEDAQPHSDPDNLERAAMSVDEHTEIRTVIPAQSGWAACVPNIGDDDEIEDLHERPIVAWLVEVRADPAGDPITCAWPICGDGLTDSADAQCVKRPDGRYVFIEDRDFDTKTSAIAYAAEQHRREQRRRTGRGGLAT